MNAVMTMLSDMATDKAKAAAFKKNPAGVMDSYGVTEHQKAKLSAVSTGERSQHSLSVYEGDLGDGPAAHSLAVWSVGDDGPAAHSLAVFS